MSLKTHDCRLYLITPPKVRDAEAFAHDLDAALSAGEVAAVQIRLKDTSPDDIRAVAKVLTPIAHRHGAAVLMNDFVELARELGLDGVHVGQSDMAYRDARRILGPNAMIGVTCHNSRHLAMDAAEAGADYVAFGAFYPTATKTVEHMAELETLSIWQETMETPCVAIGGITAGNATDVAKAGADFIAVSGAVWNHPQGPAEGVKALLKAIS
ncbi:MULTISPECIES: thiamine phosphate synthase [Asticcacaulis]|uniref:thiamine phosphate synthase n=1 Tax=Asticcacaulis TaxID=76890 RepID=UPI001AE84639|nr:MULTISPECIES: thiamine phosphate synthase [Asticcacaulis]MBP2157548.1 thiamine-phosphate pyrophosphorylase [Asticcacaulis solisilvae]MDR6798593.1 thiamine-phosphate pyrophosphorylase [Asticcacaulis sp. BE141]